jgi:hypothetical protein
MGAKLKVADEFSLAGVGEPLSGRIMLDVDDQCITPKRILTSSPLVFFRGAQLVEVTRRAGADIVLPGICVHAVELPRTDHRPVDPTRVEFPWTLSLYGPRPHFYWGELRIPVDLSASEYRKIEVSPRLSPVDSLLPSALYRLGRIADIDRSLYPDVTQFDPAKSDLRESPHRARTEELVVNRILGDYYATALAYGYDLRRFYDPHAGQRELVLCAYCLAELPDGAVACPVCAQPTGKDAPIIRTVDHDRKPCRVCKAPILALAAIWRWCKTRQ